MYSDLQTGACNGVSHKRKPGTGLHYLPATRKRHQQKLFEKVPQYLFQAW